MRGAIARGYRLLDSAFNYENEGAVGEAVRTCGVPREELRVVSKLPRPAPGVPRGGHHHRGVPLPRRPGLLRPVPHPLAEPAPAAVRRGLAGPGGRAGARAGQVHRGVQLPARTPRARDRGDRGRAEREPDRTASVLPAGAAAGVRREPGHPHPVVEPARTRHRAAVRTGPRGGRASAPAGLSRRSSCGGTCSSARCRCPVGRPERQRENLAIFDFELTGDEMASITRLAPPDGRIRGQDPAVYEEF